MLACIFWGCGPRSLRPDDAPNAAAPGGTGETPAAAFLRHPTYERVSLSPNGNHIAAIARKGATDSVVTFPAAGGKARALAEVIRDRFQPGHALVNVHWANDDRLLITSSKPVIGTRVQVRRSQLFGIDFDGSRFEHLGQDWPKNYHLGGLLSVLRDDPGHVLLRLGIPGANYPTPVRVDVRTGAFSPATRSPWGVYHWFVDHRDQIRAALGAGKPRGGVRDGELFYLTMARVDPDEAFQEVARWNPIEEDGMSFAGFTARPEIIYVVKPSENGARRTIYTYDLEQRALGDLVFEHPEVDAHWVSTSKVDGRPLYILYDTDRPEIHFLDPEWKRLQALLDDALPDRINRFVSSDRNEHRFIVESSSDVAPPEYYLFNKFRSDLTLLFKAYPELEGVELAPMKPVQYEARDGVTIHGYLTLPVSARLPIATIVLPHGGPFSRDVWGWDPEVQFLANRGFAVFQPNFRGSDGYGEEFEQLGWGQWGLAMQDDITDGVRWLIEEGVADGARIGIFGTSYGGYAALQGLVSTPELYAAGASYAGVTDLRFLLSQDKMRFRYDDMAEQLIGRRRHDREKLIAASPARNARRIRAPVLIGHGTGDPRVSVKHAEALARELKRNERAVEVLIYEDEIHGFLDHRNRAHFYHRLATFFREHLDP